MLLTRQLLLLAVLTLVLPWAGCQYLRETEKVLRQSQQDSLAATAGALAVRLVADADLNALTGADEARERAVFYSHPLQRSIVVDGYQDDWREQGLELQSWSADETLPAQILLGRFQGQAYLLIRVFDPRRRFYDPSKPLGNSDHLQLRLVADDGTERDLRVFTAAPGQVQVDAVIEDGHRRREHQVVGVWTEQLDHYLVELQLPWAWLTEGLAVNALDGGASVVDQKALTEWHPVVTLSEALSRQLAAAVPVDTRIRVLAPGSYLIGEAGGLPTLPEMGNRPGEQLFARVLRWVLGRTQATPLPPVDGLGQISGDAVAHALQGTAGAAWYRLGGRRVVQVAVPVQFQQAASVGEQALAAVVVEQTTDIWETRLNQVAGRLLLYSLLASGLAGLGLFAYASWLSWRIRRLSRAAEQAVDADGHIRGTFPRSRSGDEVGQLSRHYGDLLQRLQEYTQYLETLAQKLSHELRTPLAVVRSSLDNLQQLPLPEQAGMYTQRALSGTERLTAILNAMSAASRVEQAIRSSDTEGVLLDQWLKHMLAAYTDVYPEYRFQCVIKPGDYLVQGAPELLVQMLDKLVDNAVEFSDFGRNIEFTLAREDPWVVLQVINRGPPLPDTMQRRIFDSLISVREPDPQNHHLGLGLYIVRLIVAFHQGQVTARNCTEDGRVVFEVRLPSGNS